jgi:Flp pilus assembly protein TadD
MLGMSRTTRHLGLISFLSITIVALLAADARGQLGNTGVDEDRTSGMRQGTNTIVGQVVFPSNHEPPRRCTVRLSSVRVGEFSTLTDDNGVFTFRRLREGSYFITVEAGKEYLPAQETVDLYDNRGRTATVQIDLRLRPNLIPKPAVLNAALAGVPKAAIDLYQKGVTSAAAGDLKKAVDELKAAIALHPSFVLALNELSAVYVNQNDLAAAEQALTTAIKYEPSNATLHLNCGYVLMLENKFADADHELYRALQLNDKSARAHVYRGKVLILLGKLTEAEAELRKAQTMGGDPGILAYRYLGELYSRMGDKAKAIEALETYLRLLPTAKDADEIRKILAQLREQTPTKNPVTPL